MKKFAAVILFFFVCNVNLNAQTLPPIKIFTPEDYNADNQNWQISQAENKFIYVANSRGLLEFDGAKWNVYESVNNAIIRSVTVIKDRIYTGSYMDFGYWKKNTYGKLVYKSLTTKLEDKIAEDDQIWHILEFNEWVVFQSSTSIYFFNTLTEKFKVFKSEKTIYNIFNIENTIYYYVRNEGLYKIKDGKNQLVTNSEALKKDRIINMFSYNNHLVLLTQKTGFYKLENNVVTKWTIPAASLVEQVSVHCALRLSNGHFILGTISNGILNLKPDGTIHYQINQKNGLSNNTVLSLLEDDDHNLWVGLDNGINNINIESPVQVYNDFDGILGTVYTSIVFKNKLYIGTNQGLFFKDLTSNNNFSFIKGTSGQVWSLYNYKNQNLLCGHHSGTFVIDGENAFLVDNTLGSWDFKPIPKFENLLLKGNYDGLYILEKTNNGWVGRNKIEGFDRSSRFFELDGNNHIWVSHENKGVVKLTVDNNFSKVVTIKKEVSLENARNSSLVKYRDQILYSSDKGVYKYHKNDKVFKYDSILNPITNNKASISGKLVVDDNGILWALPKESIHYVLNDNLTNKPKIYTIPIPIGVRKITKSFENINKIGKDMYLIGTANGYLTINLSTIKNNNKYNLYLNKITFKDLNNIEKNFNVQEFNAFKNKKGVLTFDFSTPNYEKYLEVKYQYQLEGLSNTWSEWSAVSKASFVNLSFGDYVLKVRSKVGNVLSENTISYPFKVNRPFLLSNLALALYVILIGLAWFVTHKLYKRYYEKQLKRKQSENEKIIIQIKNQQLHNDIENKNRELTISKMSIIKKNEVLNGIKKELKSNESPKNIKIVNKLIDDNLNNSKDWEFFVKAFNNTDKGFLEKLQKLHPNLTSHDIRFCVYLRLNLSSKEIAELLNITVKSVETKRYRLRKRFNMAHEENLMHYILSL